MLSCASSLRSLVLSGHGESLGGHFTMSWQLLTLARWEEEKRGQSCSLERSLIGRGTGRGGQEGRSEPASVPLYRRWGAQEQPCHFSSRSCRLSPGLGSCPPHTSLLLPSVVSHTELSAAQNLLLA